MQGYSQAQAAPEPEGRLAYKWKVLFSVIFGVFMIILDTTVVNVAFQTLRREFNASINDSQWIISVYVLALGISTPMSGFLADRFGIKRIYLTGLTLFVLGSIACGFAPNLGLLIVARGFQGLGGGIAQPLGAAMLFVAFPVEEQGLALGIFGIALVVAPALGPILGGYLVDHNWWRYIFFINVPIGIVGVTLAGRWLRERRRDRKSVLDPLGLITAIVGFGAVLFAASNAAEKGWTSTEVLASFGIGAAALLAFGIVELFVAKDPLLDLRLYKKPVFLTANVIGYVSVIALFGAEFLLPVYLQALRGRTALETGLILLPLALASGITTPLAGRLYDKIGPRPLIVTGFTILLINTWQLSKLEALTPISWILFLVALRGMALGMVVQTTFATSLAAVPRDRLPRGTSLVNSTRFVVQSIGVAILATVLVSTLSPAIKEQQQRFQEAARGGTSQRFGLCESPGLAAGAPNLPPGLPAGAPKQVIAQTVKQACAEQMRGFDRAYTLTFYAALAAILIGMLLPGWPMKWAGRSAVAATGAPAPAH